MSRKSPSLKRPLIMQPLLLQFAILFISVIARAIVRDSDGGLAIRMTAELAELRSTTPDLWFVAEDDAGRSLSFGQVPSQYGSFVGTLRDLSFAQLRDRSPPYRLSAVIRRQVAPAGTLTILGHGKLT